MVNVLAKNGITGTKKWPDASYNIGKGCSNDCKYCYAAAYALEEGHIKARNDWATEKLTPRPIPTQKGVIMFPTAHDITPFYLGASIDAIEEMMLAGRNVVIVTKAHIECMKAICDKFTNHKDQLIIRVTIGSMKEKVCKFWEPGAPPPSERLEALKYAYDSGYQTSVSMEPILLGVSDAVKTFNAVYHYVREKVWIGRMNSPNKKADVSDPVVKVRVAYFKKCQSDQEILKLYWELLGDCKVAWKDSIKQVVEKTVKLLWGKYESGKYSRS
jgi:DNA repair photolyase